MAEGYVSKEDVLRILEQSGTVGEAADRILLAGCDADVVRVTRCRHCTHYRPDDHGCCDDQDYGYGHKPDDYCSYGKRKE